MNREMCDTGAIYVLLSENKCIFQNDDDAGRGAGTLKINSVNTIKGVTVRATKACRHLGRLISGHFLKPIFLKYLAL